MNIPFSNMLGVVLTSILILIILFINTVKYRKPIRDLIEPMTFFIIFLGAFFIFNFLFIDHEFSIGTIFIVFFGSLSFIIGYYSKLSNLLSQFFSRLFPYTSLKTPTRFTLIVFSLFFVSLWVAVMFLRLKYYSTSLSEFFASTIKFHAQTKMGGYMFYPLFALVTTLFYFFIFSFLEKRQKTSAFILSTILIILFILITIGSSRWNIITGIFLMPFLLHQLFIIKKPVFSLKLLIVFLLIPFLLIVLNGFRHYGFEKLYQIPEMEFVETSLLSLHGDTIPARALDQLYLYISQTNDYHYGWYFVSQFISLIPRIIWKEKPVTSFCFAYTKKVYGIDPIKDITTYTFTMFDSYAWLGWGTLLFVSFFVGVFSNAVYKSMWNRNVFFLLFVVPYILGFLPMVRGSFIDMIAFYIINFLIIILLYFVFKSIGIIKIKNYGEQ